MIVRLLMPALLLGLLAVSGGFAEEWGNLSGTITFGGDPPSASPIQVTKDVEVCSKHNLVAEGLVVNADNNGIANVVVYMYLKRGSDPPPIHESYDETADANVKLDNHNCRFEPHVVLLRTSQTLILGNTDPVGHNTKVDAVSNVGINPIVPANSSIEQRFPEEERRPIGVSCSIHPWMSAYVVIRDNPYFAVTDEDGRFEIKNVPAGKWTFQFWHEKCGYVSEVKRDGAAEKWQKGRVEIEVAAGENDLGTIEVPASKFEG